MRRVSAFLRRAVPVAVLVAVLGVGVWALFLRGGETPPRYTVELDNAFGMTKDAEVRAAGVRVGKVAGLKVSPKTARAMVEVEIDRTDFGDLRADATCSVEPQSLIGEYFLDCEPGTEKRKLAEGGTIPVERTTGTVPPDVVLAIMRRPQREQLGLILAELGAGFASRGPELQQTIKRAVPAMIETDKVLKILAAKQRTLQALTRDADTVLARLSSNRRDVGRFVREARDTATISAGRREELAETIRRLPAFLRALRPTLADLGTVAEKQTPALRDLRLSAGRLTTLFQRLGPFAEAAGPAVEALGDASVTGTRAVGPARETVRRARTLGATAREPATNLRFVLEHIDNRANAVEPSPASPGGRGFTGLEAFLRYPFVQSQAINLFDSRGYTLKLNVLPNDCSGFTNAASAKAHPERTQRCNGWLGPNQPGVTTPDPTLTSTPARARRAAGDDDEPARRRSARQGSDGDRPAGSGDPSPTQPSQPSAPGRQTPAAPVPDVEGLLEALRGALPKTPAPQQPQAPPTPAPAPAPDKAAEGLLDFLLGS